MIDSPPVPRSHDDVAISTLYHHIYSDQGKQANQIWIYVENRDRGRSWLEINEGYSITFGNKQYVLSFTKGNKLSWVLRHTFDRFNNSGTLTSNEMRRSHFFIP